MIERLNNKESQTHARALLDPGSAASFLTERLAQQLQLPKSKQTIAINGIGGVQFPNVHNSTVEVNLKSTHGSSSLNQVSAIVLPSLTKHLPSTSIKRTDWPRITSLQLADPEFNISEPIDILLGVDVYQDIIKTGVILGPRNTPAAQETIFGWVLFGGTTNVTPKPQAVNTFHTLTDSPT